MSATDVSQPRQPIAIAGGSGYVAGELLRLLAGHPSFEVVAVLSTSQAGASIASVFPHLAGTSLDRLTFSNEPQLRATLEASGTLGLFAATPHGATAALVDRLLSQAEQAGCDLRVVDLSADFRFADPDQYAAIYGSPHPAPARLDSFVSAVPEHAPGKPERHASQPGCFTTAVTLAAWPFLHHGLVEPDLFVSAITGSSGSGREPKAGTHHPARRSNLHAYAPLAHRHEAEMRMLLGRAGKGEQPEVRFVPHSGPFVRGIHATLQMRLHQPASATELVAKVNDTYADSPFVTASESPPQLSEVIGSNRCRIGVAVRDRHVVVFSVIDNLIKGAAGGAVQWMNRIFERDEAAGLSLPGLGWF